MPELTLEDFQELLARRLEQDAEEREARLNRGKDLTKEDWTGYTSILNDMTNAELLITLLGDKAPGCLYGG